MYKWAFPTEECLLLKISVQECMFTILALDSGQCLSGLRQYRYTYLYSMHTGKKWLLKLHLVPVILISSDGRLP